MRKTLLCLSVQESNAIEEEAKKLFPKAKIAICTADQSYKRQVEVLELFENNEIDIIIGTQMLAKGHHFPKLATVGILDATTGNNIIDIRMNERCFQLLHQLVGRAGREENCGSVMIQTYDPRSYVIQTIFENNFAKFIEQELKIRKISKTPPFFKLISITISSKNEKALAVYAKELFTSFHTFNTANNSNGNASNASHKTNYNCVIFPPIPAVLYKLKQTYRWRLLIRIEKSYIFQARKIIRQWLLNNKSNVCNTLVDVDPYSFM